MLLYQPTQNEIAAAVARAKDRKPHLGSRLTKAADLLTDINSNLEYASDSWRVRSQSDPNIWYAVSHAGCNCENYRIHSRVSVGYYYCKHLLVYYAYRRLLGNALNRRLVGNHQYRSERRYAQLSPGALLVDTDRTFRAITYTSANHFARHVCYLRLDSTERFVPRGDEDYLALAEWLPTVPDFTIQHEAPRMEDYTPDRQPEMSQDDFRHWMHTGEVPALRLPS